MEDRIANMLLGAGQGILEGGVSLLGDSIERDRQLAQQSQLDDLALIRQESMDKLREASTTRMAGSGFVDEKTGRVITNAEKGKYKGTMVPASEYQDTRTEAKIRQEAGLRREIGGSPEEMAYQKTLSEEKTKRDIASATEMSDAALKQKFKQIDETPGITEAEKVAARKTALGIPKEARVKRDSATLRGINKDLAEKMETKTGRKAYAKDLDLYKSVYGEKVAEPSLPVLANFLYDVGQGMASGPAAPQGAPSPAGGEPQVDYAGAKQIIDKAGSDEEKGALYEDLRGQPGGEMVLTRLAEEMKASGPINQARRQIQLMLGGSTDASASLKKQLGLILGGVLGN